MARRADGNYSRLHENRYGYAVEHIQEWIASQVGPSLAVLFETVGWSRIFELAVSSQKRLSDRQRALIKDFNSLSPALG